jgi:Hemingway/CFA97
MKEGRRSPSEADERSLLIKATLAKNKLHAQRFEKTERNNEILRVNRCLAEKLFDIQIGKKYVRNKSIVHKNVITPNMSPIGSLSIIYKRRQAQ